MKYIDLHVHSTASDGTLSPSEVVDHAVSLSLSAFALTDHDTVKGISAAKERASYYKAIGTPIEVYSGVEISAGYKEKDIHILGLFVDEHNELLNQSLENALANRNQRNDKIIERFATLGVCITKEELLEDAPDSVITRAHFARVLYKRGITTSIQEAFEKYLSDTAPCYIPREYITPEQAIGLILKAKGVPVLAHPLLYHLPQEELYHLIKRLKTAGLKGLEVYYSSNCGQDEVNLKALASHFNLIASGGSDFHGSVKPQIELGIGKGNLKIPYSVLQNLLNVKA